jgi:hypothetical protein
MPAFAGKAIAGEREAMWAGAAKVHTRSATRLRRGRRQYSSGFARLRVITWPDAALAMLLAVVLSALCSASALAGSFQLVSGKRFDLCRAYDKNLRSFPDLTSQTYEWPLNPKLKSFAKPRWNAVDARENLSVIKKLYLWAMDPYGSLDAATAESRWQQKLPDILQMIDKGMVRLEITRLDFDNAGRPDRVYRYYHPIRFDKSKSGPPHAVYGYWYVFFDDRDPAVSDDFRSSSGEGRLYDSFFFRGRFYLIGWFGGGLAIFEPQAVPEESGILIRPVCSFRYAGEW